MVTFPTQRLCLFKREIRLLNIWAIQPLHAEQHRAIKLVLSLRCHVSEAEERLEQEVQTRTRSCALEHGKTLNSMTNLATKNWRHDMIKKAHELDLRILDLRARSLGPDHPNTMYVVGNVAEKCRAMGEYKKAEQLCRMVVAWDIRNRGRDHQMTLMRADNLARVLWDRGNWKEAQHLLIPASQKLEKILEAGSLHAVASKGLLVLMYLSEGLLQEAEALEAHVMNTKRKIFGSHNRDVVMAMNNDGNIRNTMGHFAQAQILFEKVAELRKKVLEPYHPDTLQTCRSFALALWMKGHWEDAEKLELQTFESIFGRAPSDRDQTDVSSTVVPSNWPSRDWNRVYEY